MNKFRSGDRPIINVLYGFRLITAVLVVGLSTLSTLDNPSSQLVAQSPWPQFRGPNFNPTTENAKLPDTWSTEKNVEWKSELPGRGWSSPVVADGKIFLTTVTTEGKSKLPQTGTDYSNEYVAELMKQGLSEEEVKKRVTERDIELPKEVTLHYFLYCIDLESGKEVWKKEFYKGKPPGGRHRKNSFCSESPVTDGKNVFVYIANLGLYGFDLDGKQIWNTKLESHPIYLDFGTGSSPALHEEQLIIVHDNEEKKFIASYDKATGKQNWRTDRNSKEPGPAGMPKSGWVTPFIWKHDARTEIVTMSPGAAISYDLQGKEIWRMKGVTIAPAASSFAYDGLLCLDGGKGSSMFGIRPGASGDISLEQGAESNDFVAWSARRTGTYIPTPVAYEGGLYVLNDNGIITRLDAKTGEQTFKTRVKSSGADFTTSPWAYNGKVFCLSEQGDTYVLEAGKEYKLSHVNSLGDLAMASPAIVGDRLIIRTEKHLYSIRNGKSKPQGSEE